MTYIMDPVARIRSDFGTKFGIPRQPGLASALEARVIFEPAYRSREALRGLEGFSHLWLIWVFSENTDIPWSPTVRPPKLGGNTRVGVFASRSPVRPNPIGLSCVELLRVEETQRDGLVLVVRGADLMDGTPILDIKPYLPYSDSVPEAKSGYAYGPREGTVRVSCPENLLLNLPENKRTALLEVLEQDPRPGFRREPDRVYGMRFAGFEVRFSVEEDMLTVLSIEKEEPAPVQ